MAGLFKSLKELLKYKEPKDIEGFELLEDRDERMTDTGETRTSALTENSSADKQTQTKQRTVKTPLNLDKWNVEKNKPVNNTPKIDGKLLDTSISVNKERIRQEFLLPKNTDVIIRDFKVAHKIDAFIVFIDGMIDRKVVSNLLLRELMDTSNFEDFKEGCPLSYIVDNVLSINQVKKFKEYKMVIQHVLNGDTALFIDGCEEALIIESRGFEKRSVDVPKTEAVVRGSQEGFTENLRTNVTLLRKIIKNKSLVTEILPMGKTNNGNCAVMYLEGVANPKVVKEVKRRINSINADFVMGDGMLEQFIEDNTFMLFPQVLNTERPDRAASFLMEGQVVIIGEGAPFVNAVPVTFFRLFHTSEDSFVRWQYGTFLRFMRLLAFAFSLMLPGLYVAMTLYHQEMIPTELLTSIAKSKENIPFPIVVEILIMELSFELIREAGIRVPGIIGQTLGIIGALILGQAAVAANLVSPVLIIVVAVTGLGSFAIPSYSLALGVRIARFIFLIFGAIAGYYGITICMAVLGAFACSMKSFGVPFFSPIAPKMKVNPDVFIRQPVWKQKMRPDYLNTPNRKRADKAMGWREGGKGDDEA